MPWHIYTENNIVLQFVQGLELLVEACILHALFAGVCPQGNPVYEYCLHIFWAFSALCISPIYNGIAPAMSILLTNNLLQLTTSSFSTKPSFFYKLTPRQLTLKTNLKGLFVQKKKKKKNTMVICAH